MNLRRLIFSGAMLAVCALAVSGCNSSTNETNVEAPKNNVSSPAPVAQSVGKPVGDQSIQGIYGDQISLTPKTDQLTVMTVWAPSWFEGSNAQMDQLLALQGQWASRNLRIICLAYDTPPKTVKKCIADKKITFTMGQGNPTLYELLELESLPTYWILDGKGNVISTLEGYQSAESISNVLEGLAAPAAASPTPAS